MGKNMVVSVEFINKVMDLVEAIDNGDDVLIYFCRDKVFDELTKKIESIKLREEWQKENLRICKKCGDKINLNYEHEIINGDYFCADCKYNRLTAGK